MYTHPYTRAQQWRRFPLIGPVLRECWISGVVIRRDISAGILPGLLFFVAAWRSSAATLADLAGLLPLAVVYFWLYLYSFCLANQLAGMDEDRMNKPDRLLVQGVISVRGTYWRWAAVMLAYTLVAWRLEVLGWALVWQAITVLYNFAGWDRRWYTKDASMALGAISQLAVAWTLAAPLGPHAWGWILIVALAQLPVYSLQDLRDQTGDRAQGRLTLPLALGEPRIRYFLAGWFALLPALMALTVLHQTPPTLAVPILAVHAALCWVIAWRLPRHRAEGADHHTYMLYTYWYCWCMGSVILLAR